MVGQGTAAGRAMDVEALLQWAYGDQRAHEWRGERDGGMAFEVSATGRVMNILALGTVVQGGGGMAAAPDAPHADALALHGLVCEMDRDLRGVVIACALSGQRPETYAGVEPRIVGPVTRGAHGRPVVVYEDAACRRPSYCPVAYAPSEADVRAARRTYAAWWLALDWLREWAPEVLVERRVAGFAAAREPWA